MKENEVAEGLDRQTVESWIKELRNDNRLYEVNLGIALEHDDEIAIDFLKKAVKIDKDLVEKIFPNFLSLPLEGKR
jgi:hypothetical protein